MLPSMISAVPNRLAHRGQSLEQGSAHAPKTAFAFGIRLNRALIRLFFGNRPRCFRREKEAFQSRQGFAKNQNRDSKPNNHQKRSRQHVDSGRLRDKENYRYGDAADATHQAEKQMKIVVSGGPTFVSQTPP